MRGLGLKNSFVEIKGEEKGEEKGKFELFLLLFFLDVTCLFYGFYEKVSPSSFTVRLLHV